MIAWFYSTIFKPVVRAVTPRWAWRRYGDALWLWYGVIQPDYRAAEAIGWPTLLKLRLRRIMALNGKNLCWLKLSNFRHRIYYRPGTSDLEVVRQVFASREYRCVTGEPDVNYIIDCGANVGLTSLYLLDHYPSARAVVVEPDAGNMRVCRKNLAPFADRVTFVESGVWSASVPLVVERCTYRDGAEWAIQVRPARPGEAPDLTALTVSDLLAAGGFPRVDILKMDIEAAEAEVFAGPTDWLDRTRTLVIELHGPDCERAVARAVSGRLDHVGNSGELTVYQRYTPEAFSPCA